MSFAGHRVALVEDDEIMGASLQQRLELEGAEVIWLKHAHRAIGALRSPPRLVHAVVCDIRLPDGDGESVYRAVAAKRPPPPFLFVTGYGTVEQAVRLMRAGAADYILKPFEMPEFLARLGALLAGRADTGDDPSELGISAEARRVEALVAAAAAGEDPVAIVGGPGLGKARLARRLHALSDRSAAPFVALSLAREGAGAADRLFGASGLLHAAGEGTILIEAVDLADASLQGRLLHVLENGCEARLVVTFGEEAQERLRADLYWRLAAGAIRVPPLAARPEDALWLLERFFARMNPRRDVPFEGISTLTEEAVRAHDWPGGGREMRARLRRAMELGAGPLLFPADMFSDVPELSRSAPLVPLAEARDAAERRHIRRALEQAEGQMGAAARLLGISRTTLWEKMQKLDL